MANRLLKNIGITRQRPRTLGHYALVYILEGRGTYGDAKGREMSFGPGNILLLVPELSHWYEPPPGETWHEVYFVFEGPVFHLLREKHILDENLPVQTLKPIDFWLKKFEQVIRSSTVSDAGQLCEETGRLVKLLCEINAEAARGYRPGEDWLEEAKDLMRGKDGDDVPQIARTLGMSYENFRKKFTKMAGMSPGRYRHTTLIEEACRLLYERQYSLKEISALTGFYDEFHFSKRFKQITGMSPTEYRNLMPVTSSKEAITVRGKARRSVPRHQA